MSSGTVHPGTEYPINKPPERRVLSLSVVNCIPGVVSQELVLTSRVNSCGKHLSWWKNRHAVDIAVLMRL